MIVSKNKQCDVTVILNIWKRNHIEEQIQALMSQTKVPQYIWILHENQQMPIPPSLNKLPFIHVFKIPINLKYFGRYSLAQHCPTVYTWILDDDVIPSSTWIEKCESVCEANNAIVCSSGRIIPNHNFFPERVESIKYLNQNFIGDGNLEQRISLCEEDTKVDYGCNSFFFKTYWQKYFWSIWPQIFETGEDIHLSATCHIKEDIVTIVPKQTSCHDSGNLKLEYGRDAQASCRKQDFLMKRSEVLKYLINRQEWTPILWK